MENEIIKTAFKLGNSAGVLVPKEWENKKVKVQLISKSIKQGVFEILEEENLFENIIGVYQVGSYARGDYDIDSDIDILVITDKISKLISKDNYEITLVPKEVFLKNLSKSLYNLSLIREAKPIINLELLKTLKQIKANLKVSSLLKEIRKAITINNESILSSEELRINVSDGIIYSLVLRLRELYLIKSLIKNRSPNKKEFLVAIGDEAYESYLRVKRDKKELEKMKTEDSKKLIDLSKKWLKELQE